MPKRGRPIKYPGGKAYLAQIIIWLLMKFPHINFVEAFCGGCQVLFARNPDHNWMAPEGGKVPAHQQGSSEVINDIWSELTNFYDVLRDPKMFNKFLRKIQLTPFSQIEFQRAQDFTTGTKIERAYKFYVRSRMSRSGMMKDFATPVRTRTRGRKQDQVNAYLSAIEGLPEIHERLQRVLILNKDAIDVIQSEDGAHTCFYLDPPYPHETRVTTNSYQFEMTNRDHQRLLDVIRQCRGGVIISSYPNDMYNKALADWNIKDLPLKKSASGKRTKPTAVERLWFNF